MKKISLMLIFACLGFASLGAATVSVLVVEAGLPPGSSTTPSASVWESGMMDVFFDAGHIVSNAPILQIDEISGSLPPEAGHDFDQARLGGADFFVLVLLDYSGTDFEQPKEVFIRIFRVSSGELLCEMPATARARNNTDDVFFDVKQNAGRLVPQLVL
jgi:hypothetical protein